MDTYLIIIIVFVILAVLVAISVGGYYLYKKLHNPIVKYKPLLGVTPSVTPSVTPYVTPSVESTLDYDNITAYLKQELIDNNKIDMTYAVHDIDDILDELGTGVYKQIKIVDGSGLLSIKEKLMIAFKNITPQHSESIEYINARHDKQYITNLIKEIKKSKFNPTKNFALFIYNIAKIIYGDHNQKFITNILSHDNGFISSFIKYMLEIEYKYNLNIKGSGIIPYKDKTISILDHNDCNKHEKDWEKNDHYINIFQFDRRDIYHNYYLEDCLEIYNLTGQNPSATIKDILGKKYDRNSNISDKQMLLLVKNKDNFLSEEFITEWILINGKKIIVLIVITLLSESEDYNYLKEKKGFEKYVFSNMLINNSYEENNNPYIVLAFTKYNE